MRLSKKEIDRRVSDTHDKYLDFINALNKLPFKTSREIYDLFGARAVNLLAIENSFKEWFEGGRA